MPVAIEDLEGGRSDIGLLGIRAQIPEKFLVGVSFAQTGQVLSLLVEADYLTIPVGYHQIGGKGVQNGRNEIFSIIVFRLNTFGGIPEHENHPQHPSDGVHNQGGRFIHRMDGSPKGYEEGFTFANHGLSRFQGQVDGGWGGLLPWRHGRWYRSG